MRDSIMEKLKSSFGQAPASEAAVAYTLIEVRKCLERMGNRSGFKILTFFCDWVVHVQLDRSGGAKDALSVLDSRLGDLKFGSGDGGYDFEVHRFLIFDGLLEELDRFCVETKLPARWTRDPTLWYGFVRYYGEIVRDCPLVVNRRPADSLPYIRRVVLTAVPPEHAEADHAGFKLEWEFTLSDERSMKLNVALRCPQALAVGPTETSFGLDTGGAG
jgi:hypothetical protein